MRPIYLFSISSHSEAIHVNPLDITFFQPDIDFYSYDYFIVTSKQAVKALQQYKLSNDALKPALCISNATAKAYENLGGTVLDVGAGYGDDLTHIITAYPKQTKWLYLRAKEVASELATRCQQEGYAVDEVILYESVCSQQMQKVMIQENAILIFTSPSSVKCFLEFHSIQPTHKVIVIGTTTAKALPANTQKYLSKEKTIASCIELARDL